MTNTLLSNPLPGASLEDLNPSSFPEYSIKFSRQAPGYSGPWHREKKDDDNTIALFDLKTGNLLSIRTI